LMRLLLYFLRFAVRQLNDRLFEYMFIVYRIFIKRLILSIKGILFNSVP
jgi:hypothetical protein